MKKSLLSLVALTAATSAFAYQKADPTILTAGPKVCKQQPMLTRADGAMESFDFTYASDPYNGYALNGTTGGTTRVYLAFEMSASDVKTFAGSKVTGFSVYSPFDNNFTGNTITDARFFYSFDLKKEAYTQDFNMTKSAAALNTLKMDEPYTITGEEDGIVFGYSFVVPKKNNMYYLLTDGYVNEPATGLYGMSDDNTFPKAFYTYGEEIGALCMSIKLERENLPKFVSFASFPNSICLPLGQSSTLPITLKATSGSPIESVEIEYTFGGQAQNATLEFQPAVPAGAGRYFGTNLEFPAFNEKYNETVEFKLTKINGIENVGEGTTAVADVVGVNEVPVNQTLLKEYTGTWCSNCTRGYAAPDYLRPN